MARKSNYPELKNAGEVPAMLSKLPVTKDVNSPSYVPPRHVANEKDVESVLAKTLETMAAALTEGAAQLRDVLDRRYISVEEAVELAEARGVKPKRRPKKGATAIDRETVRELFGRIVAFQYDKAVALLDAYGATHFDEVKDDNLQTFYEAALKEISDSPEDYKQVEEDFDE